VDIGRGMDAQLEVHGRPKDEEYSSLGDLTTMRMTGIGVVTADTAEGGRFAPAAKGE